MTGGARPSGTDFEYRVRDALREAGWRAERTMRSAQAGKHVLCDVTAHAGACTMLGVECKYSRDRSHKRWIRVDTEEIKEATRKAGKDRLAILAVNSKLGPLFILTKEGTAQLREMIREEWEDGESDRL